MAPGFLVGGVSKFKKKNKLGGIWRWISKWIPFKGKKGKDKISVGDL